MLDEQAFLAKYWYPSTHVVTVLNPRVADYQFQATVNVGLDMASGKPKVEPRQYMVKGGGKQRFPGPIANMYLDQMAKLIAQDDKNFGAFIDFTERAKYYDQLVVTTEDLIEQYHEFPQYKEEEKVEESKPEEVPFAAAKTEKPKKESKPWPPVPTS